MKKRITSICFSILFIILVSACTNGTGRTIDIASQEDLHNATSKVKTDVTVSPSGTTIKYIGSTNNLNITSDFTISTSDLYFTYSFGDQYNTIGRVLQNMTLNGNNHTITITGTDNLLLGKYNVGLFGLISNSTIKNLKIVYDLDFEISGSNGSAFGGLARRIDTSSHIENCHVQYKGDAKISFWTDTYGYHNSGFGGLIGYAYDSEITNCSVTGELNGTAGYIGGIVAYSNSESTINSSVFNGGIKTYYLEESYVGGIAGYCSGEVKASKVLLDYFRLIGQPQAWRARTSSGGGLVGKLVGFLHDSYLEFNEDGYYYANRGNNGMFTTDLNKGIIVGEATSDAQINNIYVDGMNDNIVNITYPDSPLLISLGIGKNNSTKVSNVYFIDDSYLYYYEESFVAEREATIDGYKYTGTLHNEDATVTVKTMYVEKSDSYTEDYAILTIGETSYELQTINIFTGEGHIEYWYDIANYQYIVDQIDNNDGTYTIIFTKNILHVNLGEVALSATYNDISFEDEDGIYWKYDSATNKPLLINLD